jgi:hypothetical protein
MVARVTIADRILEELRHSPGPLDDDELARRLGVNPRQTVNATLMPGRADFLPSTATFLPSTATHMAACVSSIVKVFTVPPRDCQVPRLLNH